VTNTNKEKYETLVRLHNELLEKKKGFEGKKAELEELRRVYEAREAREKEEGPSEVVGLRK
jgi:peptidoglycan hydrolase CwlO-like protein